MKRVDLLVVLAITTCCVVMTAVGGDMTESAAKPVIMRVGHVLSPGHPYDLGARKFAELVEQKSGGRIKVEVYPSGQLGQERDLIEGLQYGTVEGAVVASSSVASALDVRELFLLDMPYAFRDFEHASKVLEGPIGDRLLSMTVGKGVRGLGWFAAGFHVICNSKRPVKGPEDLTGLKIRMWESPGVMLATKLIGANVIPMAWGEVYSAMQTGVVDGFTNSFQTVFIERMYEVGKYVSVTNHIYVPVVLCMSNQFFSRLPQDLQSIVLEAGKAAGHYQRSYVNQSASEYRQKLVEAGTAINEVDAVAFRKHVEAVNGYQQFVELVNRPGAKELMESILKEGGY